MLFILADWYESIHDGFAEYGQQEFHRAGGIWAGLMNEDLINEWELMSEDCMAQDLKRKLMN